MFTITWKAPGYLCTTGEKST